MATTTVKIVGTPQAKSWSQVHIFVPQEGGQKKYGMLLAAFSFTALAEELDTASFGKEIIVRFHEAYYSSAEESALRRLKEAIRQISTEFSPQVALHIEAAAIVDSAAYIALNAGGIYLFRGQRLVPLLTAEDTLKAASGLLRPQDRLILASGDFFATIPLGTLRAAAALPELIKTVDMLTPIVHTQTDNSRMAAVIYEEVEPMVTTDTAPPPVYPPPGTNPLMRFVNRWPKIDPAAGWSRIKAALSRIKSVPRLVAFRIHDDRLASRARKKTLLVAAVLILLLGVSLYFGTHRQKAADYQRRKETVLGPANAAMDQSRQGENPLQAQFVLEQAREELRARLTEEQDPALQKEIEKKLQEIDQEIAQITGLQKVEEPDLWLDLSLIQEGISATTLTTNDGQLAVSMAGSAAVMTIDLATKKHETVSFSSGNLIIAQAGIMNDGRRIAGLAADRLVLYDRASAKVVQDMPAEWGTVVSMTAFEGNLYLVEKSQIWKLVGLDEGFSSPRPYLKTAPDWTARDMAIDGFVWVLTEDGDVYKYLSGAPDNFATAGVEPLSGDTMLFTDKNCDNLYLLDRQKTKVYQVSKGGEYQKSWFWPGIAGANDFVVSEGEGKAFLLTKDRIYAIGL